MTIHSLSASAARASSHILPPKQTLLNWARKVEEATPPQSILFMAVAVTSAVAGATLARYAIDLLFSALKLPFTVMPLDIFILSSPLKLVILGTIYSGCALALTAHLAAKVVIHILSDRPV